MPILRQIEYSCWVRGVGEVPMSVCPVAVNTTESCNQMACDRRYVSEPHVVHAVLVSLVRVSRAYELICLFPFRVREWLDPAGLS